MRLRNVQKRRRSERQCPALQTHLRNQRRRGPHGKTSRSPRLLPPSSCSRKIERRTSPREPLATPAAHALQSSRLVTSQSAWELRNIRGPWLQSRKKRRRISAVPSAVPFPRVFELRTTCLALSRRHFIAAPAKCNQTRTNVSPQQ